MIIVPFYYPIQRICSVIRRNEICSVMRMNKKYFWTYLFNKCLIETCYFHGVETLLFSPCFKGKMKVLLIIFSQELPFCGTDSLVSVSLNASILTSLIKRSVVIYSSYPHNLQYLPPPLSLISHISFIIAILIITLYLE